MRAASWRASSPTTSSSSCRSSTRLGEIASNFRLSLVAYILVVTYSGVLASLALAQWWMQRPWPPERQRAGDQSRDARDRQLPTATNTALSTRNATRIPTIAIATAP